MVRRKSGRVRRGGCPVVVGPQSFLMHLFEAQPSAREEAHPHAPQDRQWQGV